MSTAPDEWLAATESLCREVEGQHWWTWDKQLDDGTWPIYDSLGMEDDHLIARCATQGVAAWIASHCPGAAAAAERYRKDVPDDFFVELITPTDDSDPWRGAVLSGPYPHFFHGEASGSTRADCLNRAQKIKARYEQASRRGREVVAL